jgi:hypothetical protein
MGKQAKNSNKLEKLYKTKLCFYFHVEGFCYH